MVSPGGTSVSTDWLAEHVEDAHVRVVDASWYLPAMDRDAEAEYKSAHIPGAVFFDIDAIADTSSGLPHMLPAPEVFARQVGALGIARDDTIVVYDGMGLFSAPRAWWSFKAMGADKVYVLAGGMPKWRQEGRALATGAYQPRPAQFVPAPIADAVQSKDAMRAGLGRPDRQIVDARPGDRFAGTAPEPRPGLRAGHIPGSHNLPFTQLIAEGALLPPDRLRAAMEAAGIDVHKPVVSTCGSGVTAAFINLALAEIGVEGLSLYDGSWTEWGADAQCPIETGPAAG